MARVAFSDEAMWKFHHACSAARRGDPMTVGPEPRVVVCELERAGWLWLKRRDGGGYWILPTPAGEAAAARWVKRWADEYALLFGAPLP